MPSLKIDAQKLLANLQAGIIVHDKDTKIIYSNTAAQTILRLSEAQMLGKDALDPTWRFIDSYGNTMPVSAFPVNVVKSTLTPLCEYEVGVIDSSSNKPTWVICNAYPEFDNNGELASIVVNFVTNTSRHHEIPFQDIVELANDAIVVTEAGQLDHPGPKIVYVNKAFSNITGYSKEETYGNTPRMLQGKHTSKRMLSNVKASLLAKQSVQAQILNYHKSGTPYWIDMNIFPLKDNNGEVKYFAAIERDVTQIKHNELQLREQATHDPLTDLLNRRGFEDSFAVKLRDAESSKMPYCFFIIDLDRFKNINDQYGHDAGDKVLVKFSKHLKDFFRRDDLIARIGGEEFCGVLFNIGQSFCLDKLEKLQSAMRNIEVEVLPEQFVKFTFSIGVTFPDVKNSSLLSVLKVADTALYQAKNNGRDRIEWLPMPDE